ATSSASGCSRASRCARRSTTCGYACPWPTSGGRSRSTASDRTAASPPVAGSSATCAHRRSYGRRCRGSGGATRRRAAWRRPSGGSVGGTGLPRGAGLDLLDADGGHDEPAEGGEGRADQDQGGVAEGVVEPAADDLRALCPGIVDRHQQREERALGLLRRRLRREVEERERRDHPDTAGASIDQDRGDRGRVGEVGERRENAEPDRRVQEPLERQHAAETAVGEGTDDRTRRREREQ